MFENQEMPTPPESPSETSPHERLSGSARVVLWVAHIGFAVVAFVVTWALSFEMQPLGRIVVSASSLYVFQKIWGWVTDQFPRFPFIAGVYGAVFGVIGLPFAAVLAFLFFGFLAKVGDSDAGVKHATSVSSVSSHAPSTTWLDPVPEQRFRKCFEELYPDEYSRQIRMLRGRGTSTFDAEEAASDALTGVCVRYMNGKISEQLPPYFARAVHYGSISAYRKNRRCEASDRLDETAYGGAISEDEYLQNLISRMHCEFEEDEIRIVELTFKGFNQNEIATQLGISRSSVAKKLERAKPRLWKFMKN